MWEMKDANSNQAKAGQIDLLWIKWKLEQGKSPG
jgi:hypothetical protein